MIEYISQISSGTKKWQAVFTGRRPTKLDIKFVKNLVTLGIAKEISIGTFIYCGVASAILNNGTEIEVPDSGFLDLALKDIKNKECFIEK